MSSKVSRRILLGSLFTGLVSCPFIMYILRQKYQNELVFRIETERSRDYCVEQICQTNQMTKEQVEYVISTLILEKEKWLKFRTIQASIVSKLQGRLKSETDWKGSEASGKLAFSATFIKEAPFPWDFSLEYMSCDSEQDKYSFSTFGDGRESLFLGKRIEVADHNTILQLITIPLTYFTQFLNVEDLFFPALLASGDYSIESVHPKISTELPYESFLLISSKKMDNPLPHAIFKKGHFSGVMSAPKDVVHKLSIAMDKFSTFNDFSYPSVYNLFSETKEKEIAFTLLFSDIKVKYI